MPIVTAINEQGRHGEITIETTAGGEYGYARSALGIPIPVPNEIGFAVADTAVNARSCLDMAGNRDWRNSQPWAVEEAQLPD